MKDVSMFFSTDEMRPIMQNVFYTGTHGGATNAHIAIRWPDNRAETPKAPDLNSVYPFFTNPTSIPFNINDYKEWKQDLPTVRESIECDECDGCGEVEWEYKHYEMMDECPRCDGKGHVKSNKMISDPNKDYDLIFVILSQKVLDILCKFLEQYEGLDSIKLTVERDKPRQVLFTIDQYEILMMAIVNN
jgi:hypothetical protein